MPFLPELLQCFKAMADSNSVGTGQNTMDISMTWSGFEFGFPYGQLFLYFLPCQALTQGCTVFSQGSQLYYYGYCAVGCSVDS